MVPDLFCCSEVCNELICMALARASYHRLRGKDFTGCTVHVDSFNFSRTAMVPVFYIYCTCKRTIATTAGAAVESSSSSSPVGYGNVLEEDLEAVLLPTSSSSSQRSRSSTLEEEIVAIV